MLLFPVLGSGGGVLRATSGIGVAIIIATLIAKRNKI